MAVDPNNYVTPTEVENNYEFKLMKKILRQEFPWVKDVLVPSDEEINKYNLIFFPIIIDPFMLQKEIGLPLERWIKRYILEPRFRYQKGPYIYTSAYLSTLFHGDRDVTRDIQNDMEKAMRSVSNSAAIPFNLKLGKGRNFTTGEFIVPEMDIPEDAFFVGDNPMTY